MSGDRPASEASAPRPGRPVVAFVTGKLAEPSLRRVLAGLGPELPFPSRVIRLNIDVAALLTAGWVARQLRPPPDVGRVVLPGHCRGDLDELARRLGVPVERGPEDLYDLPAHYGRDAAREEDWGEHAIEILAEINHVPRLETADVVGQALELRRRGADVIDLGCDPGGPFRGIGELVRRLRGEGLRVSIDSFDPREIEPAARAGAELVLSVNSRNLEVARDLPCEVVVIPDDPATLGGLAESVGRLEAWGVPYRIDPVIEPIGFGFARSLARYVEVRDRWPRAAMLLGVGNITELTDADSAPINVLLLGFCEELGIRSVLTTEVIHWARTSVEECDLARRLVHHAVRHHRLPKHLEPRLHLLRDPAVVERGPEEIDRLARAIRDRNFRIFAERGAIHVLSRDLRVEGDDPFRIFDELGVEDPSHAFYLGYELAKAATAVTLGKDYRQDEALRWGYLTREEASAFERRKREGRAPAGGRTGRRDTGSDPSGGDRRSASRAGRGDADDAAADECRPDDDETGSGRDPDARRDGGSAP